MQIIKSFIKVLVFIFPMGAFAQSTFLIPGSKDYQFIDRLEIKQQTNTDLNFSTAKPYNRKYIVQETEFLDSARLGYKDSLGQDKYKDWTDLNLTKVDEYNLRSLLMNNSEWVTGNKDDFASKKPIFKTFYKTKPNMYEVNVKDFFLVINPLFQISQAIEPGYDESIFLNSRGITLRGRIADKIGFSSSITDNQERGPLFFQEYVGVDTTHSRDTRYPGIPLAVPGYGFYKTFKTTGVDYFDARGYITFGITKYIDVQFGYDKNFIGNGYRSLYLSDWGNSNLFLKLNTRIWKINYENLFMELIPQYEGYLGNTLLPRKYAAMHHLSMNVTKWLNLGLFEGIVFGREDHFDFEYLNPIIFYRSIESGLGSADNALIGFDYKANVAHRLQFYGQLVIDEFKLDKVKENKGWWANKWALQTGAKYVDAFGVNNLDLQAEVNIARPFIYSHTDSVANYTHYNQPLAHPLGANFKEFIGSLKYQPAPRWYISGMLIYYNQGIDTSTTSNNIGFNIFRANSSEERGGVEDGFKIGGGRTVKTLNTMFQVSYEWKENIYFDISYQYRNSTIANTTGASNTSLVNAGIRVNMAKRVYDF